MGDIAVCGFCRAEMAETEYVAHDIATHDGLGRMRDVHDSVCRFPSRGGCICAIGAYEAEAARKKGGEGP